MPIPSRSLAGVLAAIIGLSAAAAFPALSQDAHSTTMIVFDGSGSMWGKLASTNAVKFQTAREALRDGLAKAPAEARVGMASFGHRRPSDCSDVEIMLTPEMVSAERIIQPLEKLNPKGKGPLVNALREVAKGLAAAKDGSSIVLIHDDLDNCQQDVCAAAKDIQSANPKLPVHVVSLGMRKDDFAKMSCLPKATGGRHYDIQEIDELKSALAEVFTLGAAAPRPRPQPAAEKRAPVPSGQRATIEPPADTAPPGLYPVAILAAGGQPLDTPTRWRIYRDPAAPAIAEVVGANPHLPLAAGAYVVEARTGLVSRQARIEVKASGPTRMVLALDAGLVRIQTPWRKGEVDTGDTVATLSEAAGSGRTLWIGAPGDLVVPAGSFRIAASNGRVRQERTAAVSAGAIAEVDLTLQAGRLKLRATDKEGAAPLDPVLFVLTEDAPDSASGRREVARSAAPEADLLLPAGTYYITARYGAVEARDHVAIAPGDTLSRTLVMPIGHIAIASRLQNGAAPPTDQIIHRVMLLEGGTATREVARASGLQTEFQLTAGRYRIESQLGALNATAAREIDVRAGSRERIGMEHAAGTVRLRLVDRTGKAIGSDLSWDIRDNRDRPVWRTIQQEPRAILAAGSYKVRIEARDRRLESTFEVRIGEQRTIDIISE